MNIIHQTWKNNDIPQKYKICNEKLKTLNSNWNYKLWTDIDNELFVKHEYPYFLDTYQNFTYHIQRVDAIRYLILYKYGGIYIDLDYIPNKKFDEFLNNDKVFLPLEPETNCKIHNKEIILTNSFMYSPKEHPFFLKMIDDMMNYKTNYNDKNNIILDTTGPFALTRVYLKYSLNVSILDSYYFCPLFLQQLENYLDNPKLFKQKTYNSYCVHLFSGSWWKNNERHHNIEQNNINNILNYQERDDSTIPKIIHLMWKNKTIPDKYYHLVETIKNNHSNWNIIIWTDDEMFQYMEEYGSEYLEMYINFPYTIQRCDFFRLFIVYKMGGIYLDIDIEMIKSFNELPTYIDIFFPCEKKLSKKQLIEHNNRDSIRIANYAFGSQPNHPFLNYLLSNITINKIEKTERNYVLETTGPGYLTTQYHDYTKTNPNNNITLLYPDLFDSYNPCGCGGNVGIGSCSVGNYGKHYHLNSWIKYGDNVIKSNQFQKNNILILNTYQHNQQDEGLSVVYHSIKTLGKIVSDTSMEKNKIVFVAGLCISYLDKLSKNNRNIIYTTYEFYPLPNFWKSPLHFFDGIIVPHSGVKDMFIKSGIKKPIYIVQQSYPIRHFLTNMNNNKYFTLGFLGVPVKRKNLDLLIQSIIQLSKQIPHIILKIHISKKNSLHLPNVDINENKYIQVSYGYKTNEEIDEWYSSLNAYIFPSSGEGWSFTPRETLSLGIPTIISNCIVHQDLKDFCSMIELPITIEKINQSILRLYNNIEHYKNIALKGSKYVKDTYSKVNMIKKLKDIIHKYKNLIERN